MNELRIPEAADVAPPTTPPELLARLDTLGIAYQAFEHEAVFTVEQSRAVHEIVPGVHCKNLFLKDNKDVMFLVVVPADRQVDLKALPDLIGSKRLSFGSPDRLRATLGVEPGSVTPFALINDRERRVAVRLDRWMMEQPLVNYHPLVNTGSVCVTPADLLRFIESCGHVPEIVDLGGAPEAHP